MNTKRRKNRFDFKQFTIVQEHSTMKVGTDGVLIGAWADTTNAAHILDIGTGTGLIALMMAQRHPFAKIDGVEMDEQSFQEATCNVIRSPWSDRITIISEKIQDFAQKTANKYDLIITNPPYFTAGPASPLERRYRARHNRALTAQELLEAVNKLLNKSGRFCVILPVEEGMNLIGLASEKGLFPVRKTAFYPKPDKPQKRWLLEFSTQAETDINSTTLIQYDRNGEWSHAYKCLSKDFYTKL